MEGKLAEMTQTTNMKAFDRALRHVQVSAHFIATFRQSYLSECFLSDRNKRTECRQYIT